MLFRSSHAEDDRRRREEVEVRNEADNAAYTAEKTLRDLGDRIPADLKSDVDTKIADVRAALGTDDIERMRSAKDALQQAMYKVSEQIYAAGSGGATSEGQDQGQPGEGGPSDDDTVDAQFKEE